MIYSIHESNKVDEFVKTKPKHTPKYEKDIDDKEVKRRIDIWDSMTKEEKAEALLKSFPDSKHYRSDRDGNRARISQHQYNMEKYDNITNNHSINVKHNGIRINNKFRENSIDLHGIDADNFLKHIGVSINMNNNTISIGEFTMDGYLGQTILAENGIILNEDHIVVEDKIIFKLLF